MSTVLFFRPNEDLVLSYASYWAGLTIDYALTRGYDVVDLYGADATKENLEKVIINDNPKILVLVGHGLPSTFTGYKEQPILEACVNDGVIQNTVSHFLSCYVGMELLPSAIGKGAIWTLGYQTDFQFLVDTRYSISEDPLAEPSKHVTVAIIKRILDGGTLKEVWDAGIAKCDEWIARLWNRTGIDWAEVIACLKHNRDGMIGLGAKEVYVLPPKIVRITPQQALGLGLIFLFLFSK